MAINRRAVNTSVSISRLKLGDLKQFSQIELVSGLRYVQCWHAHDLFIFVIDPLNAPYQPQPIDPYAGHTSQPPFPGASHYRNYPQQQTTPGSQIDMNRSWACQHCTYLNPDTNSICENCFKSPNFNLEILTEVLTARLLMAIKYCDKCYHPNRMVDVICTKCRNMIIHS